MKKMLAALAILVMATVSANAGEYHRWRYPDLYPGYGGYPNPYYYGPYPYYAPPRIYVPPPVVVQPPIIPFVEYWAGVIIRGLQCGPQIVGYDRWGRPIYRPVC